MADSTIALLFSADTKGLDQAKEKLADLGEGLPTTGNLIRGLGQEFMALPGPIGMAAGALTGMAVAAGVLGEMASKSIDSLMEMSSASGVSAQNLQEMKLAMGMTGASTENLGGMLNKLNKSIGEAQDPTSRAAVAMKMLGVSQEELAKGDTAEVMQHVAKSLSDMAPSANKAALEMAILGKSGAEADEELKSYNENLAKAKQILADHGAITADDIVAQKSLNAAIAEAKAVFEGLGLSVLREVIPTITSVVQWFDNVTKTSGPLMANLHATWDAMKTLASTFMEVGTPVINLVKGIASLVEGFFQTKEAGTFVQNVIETLKESWANLVLAVKVASVAIYATVETLVLFVDVAVRAYNAIKDLGHGGLSAAAHEFDGFTISVKNGMAAIKDFASGQFKTQVKDNVQDPLEAIVVTAQRIPASAESIAAAMKIIAAQKTVDDLNQKWKDQQTLLAAAQKGLEAYKAAEVEVAANAEVLKLAQAGASKEQQQAAANALRGATATKQQTEQQISGLNELKKLQEEYANAATKGTQSELTQVKALIDADKQMEGGLKTKLLTQAAANDAQKISNELATLAVSVNKDLEKDYQGQIASLTLSTTQLKNYNQELQIRNKYAELLAKTEGDAHNKVEQQMTQEIQKLHQEQQQVQQLTTSWKGFQAGAQQAIQNTLEQMQNMQKLGGQLVDQFNNSFTEAFQNMGQGGKAAFTQLLTSMLQFFEGWLVKLVLAKAEQALFGSAAKATSTTTMATAMGQVSTMEAAEATPQEAWAIASEPYIAANAASIKFASGGVFDNGGINFNIGQMSEAGPEAVMPLSRDSQGRLGVNVGGGSGTNSSGGDVHIHGPQITINGASDPHETAKQVRKQLKLSQTLIRSEIARQQRPNGMLHQRSPMLAS